MSNLEKKNYSIHIPERLSFYDLLYLLENYFWDPTQKHQLGKVRNLIKSFSRNFVFVDEVDEVIFLRYWRAGPKIWILYQDLVSKAKKKQEEFLNL
jgi:hypothetical protein